MKNDRLYFEGGRFLVKLRGGFFYLCGAIAKAALLLQLVCLEREKEKEKLQEKQTHVI